MRRTSLLRVFTLVAGLSGVAASAPAHAQETTAAAETAPVDDGGAAPAPELSVVASFFSRYELRNNYAELGASRGRLLESDGVAYRARLGLATRPLPIGDGQTVEVALVPQASGFWADSGSTLSDDGLDVHEAYVRLAGTGFRADVGRFEMAYGDHLVIGNVGWHETGRSFDGARLHVEPAGSGLWVDGFVTQLGEGRGGDASAMGEGDWLFFGVYAGVGPAVADDLELDLYGFGQLWPSSSAAEATQERAFEATGGARVVRRQGRLDVRLETGAQIGTRPVDAGDARKAIGYHADAEIGVALAERAVRVAVGGFYASGDDPDTARDEGWDQLFPTAHKFLGYADIIGGRSNVTGGLARASYRVSDELKLAADGHLFVRPHAVDGDAGYAGAELDLGAAYAFGGGLVLRGGYSLFLPAMAEYGTTDPASFAEVELRYDLK